MNNQQLDSNFIDVRKLMQELSVEELCQTAEQFFGRLSNWDYLLAKPFSAINETPELLICFAQVVQGLNLLPDMTILDFGAGSCWTSHFLSQLGLEVIALDVSPSALKIGQEMYNRHPIIGHQPAPKFLQFNGYSFDLPNNSVDRISCWDAFHHVPNPGQVLKEMGRVLRLGGIAGFSEPGPDHSKSPQSQYEMRTNRVIENDINVAEIWNDARDAGFTGIKVALFNPASFLLSLEEFEACLADRDSDLASRYIDETRAQARHRRVFFLFKGESAGPADSRQRCGLLARLGLKLTTSCATAARTPFRFQVTVENTGTNVWLPTTARFGAVHLGIHLHDENGVLLNLDYFRHPLTPGEGRAIQPGEKIEFQADVPSPPRGKYILEFDLVSERVCWFEHNGSSTVKIAVEVT